MGVHLLNTNIPPGFLVICHFFDSCLTMKVYAVLISLWRKAVSPVIMEAGCVLPTHAPAITGWDARCVWQRAMISGHRRHGLAGGEQWEACVRSGPGPCRQRVVFHTHLKELSAQTEGARYRANCLPVPRDPFKRDTVYLGTWAT